MSEFSISFVANPPRRVSYEPKTEAVGKVTFDDFEEHFVTWLGFWKMENYEEQWREGLHRVLGGVTSCLITYMDRPDEDYIMRAWLLYPEGAWVLVQEKLFFADQFEVAFCAQQPYQHVPKYQSHSEDGEKLSEWRVEIEAIKRFVETIPGRA